MDVRLLQLLLTGRSSIRALLAARCTSVLKRIGDRTLISDFTPWQTSRHPVCSPERSSMVLRTAGAAQTSCRMQTSGAELTETFLFAF